MASILSRLNSAQRQAYTFFQGGVARGWSANETLRRYADVAGSIRRSAGLDLFRYIAGTEKAGQTISHIRKDFYPTLETIPYSRTDIRSNYSYNVRLDLVNSESGERFSKNITVTSSRNMRINEIEAAARDAFYSPDAGREDTNVEIVASVIESARRRANEIYNEE